MNKALFIALMTLSAIWALPLTILSIALCMTIILIPVGFFMFIGACVPGAIVINIHRGRPALHRPAHLRKKVA